MISDLHGVLTDLQDSWTYSEDPTTIKFSSNELTISCRERIFEQIADIRSIFDGRSLIFKVSEERDIFEYRIHWEPNNNITRTRDQDEDTEGDDLFQDDAAISAIETLRNNRITNTEQLRECLDGFIGNENVKVSFVYRVNTADISGVIKSEIDELNSVRFYVQKSTFLDHIDIDEMDSLKEILLPANEKQLFVIQDIDAACYGKDLGFFSLSNLFSDSYNDFLRMRSEIERKISKVGRECVIDKFESIYIPPDFFELQSINDESFVSDLFTQISGYQLLYSIFSLSNVVSRRSDSWQIRINGKKILEENVKIDDHEGGWELKTLTSERVESDVLITKDMVSSFVEVFQWTYEIRETDRLSVLRNIITLYTTTIEGLIEDIDEIFGSSKSNFQFYAEESVDEFLEMQQDVSNYLLETQREISELRRSLANNLSRDLFRVFGFLIVVWVGIFLQLEQIATVQNALSLSLVPVILYLILSIRAVMGLNQQFISIEERRDSYYEMYKRQLSEEFFDDIVDSDEDQRISSQFQTDKCIYYIVFGGLLLFAIYAVIDLQVIHGPVSEIASSILSEAN